MMKPKVNSGSNKPTAEELHNELKVILLLICNYLLISTNKILFPI